ncbi:putative wall-associated receptor kinase-like 16 [Zingiber officinale]|uniref:putative wall-associated receptor kinase-like 16 n=1 Tax=Zingiber officinale TaxID=94328 RepID=UPI001C4D761B|nr:putative wall-associated receptor kinase-like 16 [Zingiber officinale]
MSSAIALVFLLFQLLLAVASAVPDSSCLTKCGDVDIPYPFGVGINCSWGIRFNLTCDEVETGVKKPFLFNVEVHSISLLMGQLRFLNPISSACYNTNYNNVTYTSWWINFEDTPYRFSDLHNKFTAIGCDTLAYIIGSHESNISYQSGCVSMCEDEESIVSDSCSGMGCCQTSIPKNLKFYEVSFDEYFNNSAIWRFSRCSYAVLLDAEWFEFQTSYITTTQLMQINSGGRVPVVIDWAIGNETCEVAKLNLTSYACISNSSDCVESSNGPGYLCNCSKGYQGNPYVSDGCQDINECNLQPNPCSDGICQNLPGNYSCDCPEGKHGDAYNGTCIPNQKLSLAVKAVIGTSISLTFLLVFGMCICMIYQRRKLIQSRKRYFSEHGGMQLLEEMRKLSLAFRIFSKEELERATNRFDKNRILGQGGYGTVYKGDMGDNQFVAIKQPKVINERQKKEFGKEMLILSQVNHRNIVKLLGCCLEVEVPMLVYEFVPNGNLYELIHSRIIDNIPLAVRLNIARDSADALAYLHYSASPPIIHGDVKSANILLHENYTAKVSDFGASRLNPKDEDQFATLVQGTCGYLDPEYLQTCKLTEKSDVYSFGVVLLELLTRKKAIYFEENGEETSLASSFILAKKEDRLEELLDNQVTSEGDAELIERIGEMAMQCLSIKGEERPTMKNVADQLNSMRKFKQHPWTPPNAEGIESFLPVPSDAQTSTGNTSYIQEVALLIEYAR